MRRDEGAPRERGGKAAPSSGPQRAASTAAALAGDLPLVQGAGGVQHGDLGAEDLAACVPGRAHLGDLGPQTRHDLLLAGQRDVPAVGGEQQRNTEVTQQRTGVPLAPAARREHVEVLTEPPAHVAAVHTANLSPGPDILRAHRTARGPGRARTVAKLIFNVTA